LRELRPDVLHVHLTGYRGGRIPLLAAKFAGVPATVCTAHLAPQKRQGLIARLERSAMHLLVDRWIAVSAICRERQILYLGQSASETSAIPNAVELDRYRPRSTEVRRSVRTQIGIPERARVIGCVARLSQQKGLQYLVAALPQILSNVPDAHVLLVGEGPLRQDLEEHARRLRVTERLHFAGYQQDVPRYLGAMNVFALPSLFEGMPLVLLEAMAAGLPVAATRVDGTPEVIEHEANGLLVPPGDAHALASALCRLFQDRVLARRLAAAGRETAQRFSSDAFVDRVMDVYAALRGR
jgi:glycosyltransferase involved in cell wall biosynthesis